ncbi:putative secreted protein (Por secretion system target) [Ulvibacter sp. MAR_2010_11]|uniref:T9SS type A sorting domain-containing protein n=1 Tax=Ulvibacter sp. MAR_2010_11 TaxID=1250229 RepID=UPI000C2BDC15|nr:T9SS type A sorting domain-containing protein [Ulvibacter sp. MAR_2010_11]PKA83939.1 putative secreted protein (Por secretion system target) [Ulvibacter sp. MAR_2010_11]
MKTITFYLFAFAITLASAQTTYPVDWDQAVGANATFTIEVGDTVLWTWANGVPHTVTSQAGSVETFDSGTLTGAGTEFQYTFTVVGDNPYLCEVHPVMMAGTITVEAVLSVQDKFERNVTFYPNPVDEMLVIASLYKLDSYEIYNLLGKKVGWGDGNGTFTHLNTSYLNSGVYFIKVTSGEFQTTRKIIKN